MNRDNPPDQAEHTRRTREAYDRLAAVWSSTTDAGSFNGFLERPALRSLVPGRLAGAAVLDAGCGSGAPYGDRESFRTRCEALARGFLAEGSAVVAQAIGVAPARVQFQNKDPRGWADFVQRLSQHSNVGSAFTLRNYQALRASLFDFKDDFARMRVPTLLVVGDEDEGCLETNLFLKRTIPSAGLWVLANTGHAINLEEPALFNRIVGDFLATVERGRWPLRDPRSVGGGVFEQPKV